MNRRQRKKYLSRVVFLLVNTHDKVRHQALAARYGVGWVTFEEMRRYNLRALWVPSGADTYRTVFPNTHHYKESGYPNVHLHNIKVENDIVSVPKMAGLHTLMEQIADRFGGDKTTVMLLYYLRGRWHEQAAFSAVEADIAESIPEPTVQNG